LLQALYDYQQLLAQERQMVASADPGDRAAELARIKRSFAGNKQRYLQLVEDLARLLARKKELPAQVSRQEEKTRLEKEAIYNGSVVSPKLLVAREAQVAVQEEKLKQLQEEQSSLAQLITEQELAVANCKQELQAQHDSFAALKQAGEEQQEQLQHSLLQLAEQKQELLGLITAEELDWFNQQMARFKGAPLAKVGASQICSGCRTLVTAAHYKRLGQSGRGICENCGRTLLPAADC
jgi:predicted  nucleic acid-binding Zn-ribbon protein